jgi:hypothetical protein
VADVVLDHADVLTSLPFVMIAVVDSDTDVSAMEWTRTWSQTDSPWSLSDDPLVVSGATLCQLALELELFTGFDEIWVPSSFSTARPPRDASLTAPVQLTDPPPRSLRDWFLLSGWRLGIGDGFGLNFVSSDRELSRALGLVD